MSISIKTEAGLQKVVGSFAESGDSVTVNPILTEGTKIADVSINDETVELYAPPTLSNVLVLKGTVNSLEELPTDAEVGWLYMVAGDGEYLEYVYTDAGAWECVGTSKIDLSAYALKTEVEAEATARTEADSALQTKIDAIDLTPYAKTTALSAEVAARTTAINKMQTEIETITLHNPVIIPRFDNLMSSKTKVYTHSVPTGGSESYSRCGRPVYGNGMFMKFLNYRSSSSSQAVYSVYVSSNGGTTWKGAGKSWSQYNGTGYGTYYSPYKLYFMNGQFVTVGYRYTRTGGSSPTSYTRPWISYSADGTTWTGAEIADNTLGTITTCVYKDGKYVYSTTNGYILSSTNHDDVASVTQLATVDIFLTLCGDTIIALAETGEVYTSPMSTMSDTSWTQMTTVGTDLTMTGVFSNDTTVVAYGNSEVWYSTDYGTNWYAAIDNTTSAQLSINVPYGCYVPELYDYKFFLCDTDRIHMSFDGKKWDKYTTTTYIEGLTYDEDALVIGVKGGVYRSEGKGSTSVALEDIINYILINYKD